MSPTYDRFTPLGPGGSHRSAHWRVHQRGRPAAVVYRLLVYRLRLQPPLLIDEIRNGALKPFDRWLHGNVQLDEQEELQIWMEPERERVWQRSRDLDVAIRVASFYTEERSCPQPSTQVWLRNASLAREEDA